MKFIPHCDILNPEDYKYPFYFNYSHYYKVTEEREKRGLPLMKDYKETFDCRTGYYITGEKIQTKYHPYHDMWLVDKKTKQRFHIDMVTVMFHFGKYICLSKRAEGSESHGMVNFENISCHCPYTIDSINESQLNYELIPKHL